MNERMVDAILCRGFASAIQIRRKNIAFYSSAPTYILLVACVEFVSHINLFLNVLLPLWYKIGEAKILLS